jgi:hypothetical protein
MEERRLASNALARIGLEVPGSRGDIAQLFREVASGLEGASKPGSSLMRPGTADHLLSVSALSRFSRHLLALATWIDAGALQDLAHSEFELAIQYPRGPAEFALARDENYRAGLCACRGQGHEAKLGLSVIGELARAKPPLVMSTSRRAVSELGRWNGHAVFVDAQSLERLDGPQRDLLLALVLTHEGLHRRQSGRQKVDPLELLGERRIRVMATCEAQATVGGISVPATLLGKRAEGFLNEHEQPGWVVPIFLRSGSKAAQNAVYDAILADRHYGYHHGYRATVKKLDRVVTLERAEWFAEK